jgi:hypothetical protein
MLAFTACGVSIAAATEAEEEGHPRILILEGKISELQVTATGTTVTTETLSGKQVLSATTEAKVKNCESIAGNEKDANSCKDVTVNLTGVKSGGVACRSENSKGEKDPVETILALADLLLGAELTAAKVLQPLGIGKVLGTALEAEMTVICGLLKIKMKGTLACSIPFGLRNIATSEELELTCKMKKSGDPEIGECVLNCESLKTDPYLMNFGSGFEDAWKLFTIKGKANKDIFIDD